MPQQVPNDLRRIGLISECPSFQCFPPKLLNSFLVVRHPLQGEAGHDEVDEGVLVQEAVHRLVLHGAVDEDQAEDR